ncbi:MAG: hypothetical protein ACK502_01485, partial [Alphaproteobacteria bacterium]
MKRINTRRIKAKYSYSIQELTEVLNRCPNTILGWIKNEGLQRNEGIYPYMLRGEVVIAFLKARRLRNSITLRLAEFRCPKCRAARSAKGGVAIFHKHRSKTFLLKAKCATCGGKICKIISHKNLPEIQKLFAIHTLHESAL